MDTLIADPADAPNPARASRFHAGRQWRGVGDPCRSGGTTHVVKTSLQSLRWLLTVAALIFALPAFTEVRPQPPKASDVGGAWSGYSNHRDFVRLELDTNGTGYVSVTWLLPDDPPPDVYRITRWRLSEWSVEADVEPVTRDAEPMKFKSIRYGHRSIECEFGTTNWSHRAELFSESDWQGQTKRSRTAIAEARKKRK